jgi:spore coat protein A
VPTNVMMFKVGKRLSSRDDSAIPRSLAQVPLLDLGASVKTRDLVLSELDSADPFENPIIGLINAPWSDPVTETPQAGSIEIWRLINTTATPTRSTSIWSSSRSSIGSRSTRRSIRRGSCSPAPG